MQPAVDEEAACSSGAATLTELAAKTECPDEESEQERQACGSRRVGDLPDYEQLLALCGSSRSAQRRWLAPSLRRLRHRQALRRHALVQLFGLRHPGQLRRALGGCCGSCEGDQQPADAYAVNMRRAAAPPPPPTTTTTTPARKKIPGCGASSSAGAAAARQRQQQLPMSRPLYLHQHRQHHQQQILLRRPQHQQQRMTPAQQLDEANGVRRLAVEEAVAANPLSTHDATGRTRNPADFKNIFLKGTQSANPHNDYSQHFVDSGLRPQNFIRDAGLDNRFMEYPKLRELIRLKDELVKSTATPPMYHKCDLLTFNLNDLGCKFDAILIEPPLEEYNRSHGVYYPRYWSWDEVEQLKIEEISSPRSFVWLWCGNGESLESARRCLRKWGYRRCEDICWIKTNKRRPGHKLVEGESCLFQQSKEHCLMGIKGTVRRSTDGDFIHANVDIDLIIDEEPEWGQKAHPAEIFRVIEHFCLGRRRLHVFARDDTVREGWLSVGPELTASNFDARIYASYFQRDPAAALTGCTEEIERLRPKSPPARVTEATSAATGGAAACASLNSQPSAGIGPVAGSAIGAGLGPGMPIGSGMMPLHHQHHHMQQQGILLMQQQPHAQMDAQNMLHHQSQFHQQQAAMSGMGMQQQ